jgi:hypothetical protein
MYTVLKILSKTLLKSIVHVGLVFLMFLMVDIKRTGKEFVGSMSKEIRNQIDMKTQFI